MTYVNSPKNGATAFNYCQKSYVAYLRTALLITHLNVNGPSSKLTGLDMVYNHKVLIFGRRKLMPSYIWIIPTMPLNCICSLDELTITMICGPKHTPIPWADKMQQAFDIMHVLIAADALAAYPDHNKRFDIYTNASDFKLGTCIVQEGRQVAYVSHELLKSQQNHTEREKEMLSIVATLEEF
ncbi:hypothetical protein ACHAW6_000834 [Cyclotella cf. meneghiniana]